MVTQMEIAFLVMAASNGTPAKDTDWFALLFPAIVVAVVSALFQCANSRQIKRLEAKLPTKTDYVEEFPNHAM